MHQIETWHEQKGVWSTMEHLALSPQTPLSVHTSTQSLLTHDFPTGQSLFSTQASWRHSFRALPVDRAGQEQTA
jgi:hypothetical protein